MAATAQQTAQERAKILLFGYRNGISPNPDELEKAIAAAITAAAADERERCARVVIDRGMRSGEEIIASIMAQDIRALGETK